MQTDKIKVRNLFHEERQYLIPIFQRGYVWTLDKQIKVLWRDVLDQAARAEVAHTHRRIVRAHFLGAIVLKPIPNEGIRNVPRVEVIDGQQRLTTLQLLLLAYRDVLSGSDDQYILGLLGRLTRNSGEYASPSHAFKVWPTSAFRREFEILSTAGTAEKVAEQFPLTRRKYARKYEPRPLLVQTYLFFHAAVALHLSGGDDEEPSQLDDLDPLDRIVEAIQNNPKSSRSLTPDKIDKAKAEALLQAILEQMQLVEISLDADDDAQTIFQTLNGTGVPLTPSDLVRNFVFLDAARKGEDTERLYEEWWKPYDEKLAVSAYGSETGRFWKDAERQGRLKSPRLDLFLYHYVTMRTAQDFKMGHVFQEFRDWWEEATNDRATGDELKVLAKSTKTFEALIAPDTRTRFGMFAYRLKALDTTTVYPLILYVAEESSKSSEVDFDGMLTDVESYLVRRLVCELTPKSYNRTFLAILAALKERGIPPSRAALREQLLRLSGATGEWPNDSDFGRAWKSIAAYKRLRQAKTRMILEAIELQEHGPKQERLPFDDPLLKPLQIEHVFPQWARPQEWTELCLANLDSAVLERLLHGFGNLTLLNEVLNPGVSNSPFCSKRPEIAGQSTLRLNAYFQEFGNDDPWGPSEIEDRAEYLLEKAIECWPHPLGQP